MYDLYTQKANTLGWVYVYFNESTSFEEANKIVKGIDNEVSLMEQDDEFLAIFDYKRYTLDGVHTKKEADKYKSELEKIPSIEKVYWIPPPKPLQAPIF